MKAKYLGKGKSNIPERKWLKRFDKVKKAELKQIISTYCPIFGQRITFK